MSQLIGDMLRGLSFIAAFVLALAGLLTLHDWAAPRWPWIDDPVPARIAVPLVALLILVGAYKLGVEWREDRERRKVED